MNSIVLPAGTTIYRARGFDDNSDFVAANECGDTGKVGLYFSDYPDICFGMALEYQKDIQFCVLTVNEPITLFEGKYCFRNITPRRYFKPIKKNGGAEVELIPNVEVVKDENISHFDNTAIPIYDGVEDHFIDTPNVLGEIFISKQDLHKISFSWKKIVTLDEVKRILQ